MPQNSPFTEMILQLQARILAEVPTIRFVDEDKGQLESFDTKTGLPPVSFPCVLIGFENLRADDMGDDSQMIQCDLVLRLGFPPYSSAASLMPQDVRLKALGYFDLEWQLYCALHHWKPDSFYALAFRHANTEQREDYLRVRDLRYEHQWEDTSASSETLTTDKPELDFEV